MVCSLVWFVSLLILIICIGFEGPVYALSPISPLNIRKLVNSEGVIQHTASPQKFNISVVTWNLNERVPRECEVSFLKMVGRESDAVVVGIQECENIKYRSSEGHRSRAWRLAEAKALGPKFELLCKHKLGGLQIALFAKSKFTEGVEGVQSFGIPCGLGNVVANKGASCVVVKILGKTIGFINVHLAAHDNQVLCVPLLVRVP
jgi:hypothetical protein